MIMLKQSQKNKAEPTNLIQKSLVGNIQKNFGQNNAFMNLLGSDGFKS